MIRKMGRDGKLYVPFTPLDICPGCETEIEYQDIYDGQVFVSIDDRAFHDVVCYIAWDFDNIYPGVL